METIVERIRRYCKEKGVAVSAMEKDLGFGNGYLNPKKIEDVNTDRLLKILDYLGVSAEEFFNIGSKKTQIIETAIVQAQKEIPKSVEYDEMGIVSKFNALDAHGKRIVSALLDAEYERCTAEIVEEEAPKTKIIPLFPAAAGPGEPMETTAFQEHEVDADSKAQFAVRISGDSMEPELHDGEIVLCARRVPQIGDIAVIMVNGFLYVKQYIADNFGNIYLRSLNRKRKDLDVDIMASGNDTVTGYGVVIHRHVPLVRE